MIRIVDPHVHLFDLAQGKYAWLHPHNPPFWPDKDNIHHSYTPADLCLSAPLQITGCVHIEAGFDNAQPWRELASVDKMFAQWQISSPLSRCASIATCDLTLATTEFINQINPFFDYAHCVGVRHILDENALSLLSNPQVLTNLHYLADKQYIFEAQFDLTDESVVTAIEKWFATRETRETPAIWVVDHASIGCQTDPMKWHSNLQRLAQIPTLIVKASGWEMADRHYAHARIVEALGALIQFFGVERVMLASNFPVSLLRSTYQEYWQQMVTVCKDLGLDEHSQRCLFEQTALATYFSSPSTK